MTPTRADLESELLLDRGVAPWFRGVGLDGATRDGTNRDLVGPLRLAMRDAGYPVLGRFSVTAPDLTFVPDARVDEVLDRAHLLALKKVRDLWARGDDRPGPTLPGATPPTPEARAREYARLLGILADMQGRLDLAYGDSAARVTAGVISLGIAHAPGPEL